MVTKTKTKKKIGKYAGFVGKIGVADAHGVESYYNFGDYPAGYLMIRASANRQRHAVYFKAIVSEETDKVISNLLDTGENIKALTYLKAGAKKVMLSGGGDVQRSWDMIPDPKLDPWK